MAKRILTAEFFARPAPVVARELLGKFLVRSEGGKEVGVMITETEAYEGIDDLASHASRGRTKRTEVMFGKPGYFYVYFIYGMYFMLNIVTGSLGHPSAVLIRGTDAISGPGRLTRALSITNGLNTLPARRTSGLWFEDRGVVVKRGEVRSTPRIGVAYAGPLWSKKPWRFLYQP